MIPKRERERERESTVHARESTVSCSFGRSLALSTALPLSTLAYSALRALSHMTQTFSRSAIFPQFI